MHSWKTSGNRWPWSEAASEPQYTPAPLDESMVLTPPTLDAAFLPEV